MVNSELSIEKNAEFNGAVSQPGVTRFFAHFFSYLFHPIFIPVYITWFLAFVHPGYFAGFSAAQKWWIVLRVAYAMVFFPLITVLLLKGIGFIDSVFLKTQKDRIIPYIACGIFYFWAYLVFKNQPNITPVLTAFTFAVFLSSSAALMANIWMKISMHAIGMGGIIGVFFVIMQQHSMLMTWPLSLAFLATGLVCTSRMIVSDHQPREIYAGLLVGIVFQLIAAAII
jgi:hypothetical protein